MKIFPYIIYGSIIGATLLKACRHVAVPKTGDEIEPRLLYITWKGRMYLIGVLRNRSAELEFVAYIKRNVLGVYNFSSSSGKDLKNDFVIAARGMKLKVMAYPGNFPPEIKNILRIGLDNFNQSTAKR